MSSLDDSRDYGPVKLRGSHDAAFLMHEKAQHCVLRFLLARFLLLNLLITEAAKCEGDYAHQTIYFYGSLCRRGRLTCSGRIPS